MKHAYLIMANKRWDLLKTLISMLDDQRNDLFIHVDRKAEQVPFADIRNAAVKSRVEFIERIPVWRGEFSLCRATLLLLRAALSAGEYEYLHLLSGQDLPLKSQDEIHAFCHENAGKNFIDLIPPEQVSEQFRARYRYRQFFVHQTIGGGAPFLASVNRAGRLIQRVLGLDRQRTLRKNGMELCVGSQWFSITPEFGRYVLEREERIEKLFGKHVLIPDECFLQTVFWSSPFRDTLYEAYAGESRCRGNLRYIVWSGKASPETITMKMAEELKCTRALFARKFDPEIDAEIVRALSG